MAVDHVAVIESEAARILAADAAHPAGKVPWSDRWSVNTVARPAPASPVRPWTRWSRPTPSTSISTSS
jgi:hypothetical protein